jgi:hypothetical protein
MSTRIPGTAVEEDLEGCDGAPVFAEPPGFGDLPVDRCGFGAASQGPDLEAWLAVIEAEHADGRDGLEAPVDPLLAGRLPARTRRPGGFGYGPRMAALLDDLAEDESALAMRAAHRARSMEAAREWALTSDEFVLVDARMSGSKWLEWIMRSSCRGSARRPTRSSRRSATVLRRSATVLRRSATVLRRSATVLGRSDEAFQGRVSTSAPRSVTTRVCSNCAVMLLSLVVTVQSSAHMSHS